MTITETETYESGIYQIELTDPVIGGADGIANLQAKQLANRTNWLKVALAKVIDGTTSIAKALKLATARKISLGGVLSGSASFDGSSDITIQASFADGTLTINSIQGLATALGNDANFAETVSDALQLKAPLASPALTGSPTAPTQATTDNSTKIATTAFIKALLVSASQTVSGLIEIATNAEVQTGTDALKAITPAGLLSAFVNSKGSNGYTKLPNGLIIQWGNVACNSTNVTVTFPLAFPNACLCALSSGNYAGSAWADTVTSWNKTSFTGYGQYTEKRWFAIGY